MHKYKAVLFAILISFGGIALAQQDPLEGRWQGTVRGPQGERQATVIFKKAGDTYTGAVSGLTGTSELPFKEIKLDGDKVQAVLQVDAPQGAVIVNFNFALKEDAMTGTGEANLGTQKFTFSYDLKRVGEATTKEITPDQRLEYFVGEWKFEMVGRESPLGGGGNLEGMVRFARILDGNLLEGRLEGKSGASAFRTTSFIGYNAAARSYVIFEQFQNGAALFAAATWAGPGIRIQSMPFSIKGQTLLLRRSYTVVSDNTFTVREELAVDGGPYQRLANGTYTRVLASASTNPPK